MDFMINDWFEEPQRGRDLGSGTSVHELYHWAALHSLTRRVSLIRAVQGKKSVLAFLDFFITDFADLPAASTFPLL